MGTTVIPVLSQRAARDLPAPSGWKPGDSIGEIPRQVLSDKNQPAAEPAPRGYGLDKLVAQQRRSRAGSGGSGIQNIVFNQDGGDFTGSSPADTVGDVGINYFVQMINLPPGTDGAEVLILDKQTGEQAAFFNSTDLAVGSGTGCSNGSTDPIVVFDQTAINSQGGQGVWLLSEITLSSMCIYVSQSTDPTGNYFVYEFDSISGGLPDFFKVAVWPDAYYVGANESFEGGHANYAFDRLNMVVGNTARPLQVFSSPVLSGFDFQILQPADFDGFTPPPTGSPGIFIRHNDDEAHGGNCFDSSMDCLELWEFVVDFDNDANSSFAGPVQIAIEEIDSNLCGLSLPNCVSQPGGGPALDPLREPVMWRTQYRNFGSTQQLAGSLVTDVDGMDLHGVRWFILERPSGVATGGWTLQQEGTYSIDNTNRWMSSIAMDSFGNLAIGYNVSSSATGVFPGMRYAGRLSNDPLNTLPQGEFSIIEGQSPNNSNRYGDYSALTVDPVDDCSFWYTAQYNPGMSWSTRIASFRFDDCGVPGFTLSATPLEQQVCVPDQLQDITVTIGSVAGFAAPVTLSFADTPAGAVGDFTPNPVVPGNSSIAALSLLATTPIGRGLFSINGAANGADDRTLTVDFEAFNAVPGISVLTLPVDDATTIASSPILSWDAPSQSEEFTIQVATDMMFENVVYTATDTESIHQVAVVLQPDTEYFWSVTASNPCGTGAGSLISSFITSNVITSAPNVAIPDGNPMGISDTIDLTADASVAMLTDMNVAVVIDHTFVGDLLVTLEHEESGTTVTLVDRPGVPDSMNGCASDNVDVLFDDQKGTAPVEAVCDTGSTAISGILLPEGMLGDFTGLNLNATWTVTVSDNAGEDDGSLIEWSLIPSINRQLDETFFTDGFEALVSSAQ